MSWGKVGTSGEYFLRIIKFRTIHGPNVFHYHPVMILRVDLEDYKDIDSTQFPGFIEDLLKVLPQIQEHTCSKGYAGGFLERLKTGTYLAHIIEHVALELSSLSGMDITFGKSRYAGQDGVYDIITRFKNESGMRECLKQAFILVENIILKKEIKLEKILAQIKTSMGKNNLGPSTLALIKAAKKRDIPVRRLGDASLIELGYGKNKKRLQTAVSDGTSLIATEIAQDKNLTKSILHNAFIPVPKGFTAGDDISTELKTLHPPFVVKPLDGNHGNGVCLGLKTEADVLAAIEIAKKYSTTIIVEEMCKGIDYRVLVVGGQVVAASERRPPMVIGDGTSTIEVLLEQLNSDPRRGEGHENVMTKVVVDEILQLCLSEQGLSLKSVPEKGQSILLRRNANLSSGGSAIDVTEKMHPEVKIACERTARLIGLDICGIDIIHSDISRALKEGFNIIEVNAGPGLRMHLAPSEGVARPVADNIVKMLYPESNDSRIPIVAITGTNGKTTVTRLIHKILSQKKDSCVGMTNTDGIWIGSERIASGDMTGPQSTGTVLSDPKIDAAVLEVARGGILRAGLGYDWADVGVITNISADHIGQDGLETIDDIVWVKSLVAERVRPGGTLVLNAEVPEVMSMLELERVKNSEKNYFLFSTDFKNKRIINHISNGGDACWVENKIIYIQRNKQKQKLGLLRDMPLTLDGAAKFQVENVLAAISAATALNISIVEIMNGLTSFNNNFENNGRMNIFKYKQGNIIVDYGHNNEAIVACGELVNQLDFKKKTVVLGLPGDRSDELLTNTAATASKYFDRFVIREDEDLRGRKQGELANLMINEIIKNKPTAEIEVELKECNAILYAMETMQESELVVIFFDLWSNVEKTVLRFETQFVETLSAHLESDSALYGNETPNAYLN